MKRTYLHHRIFWPLISGLSMGLIAMSLTVGLAWAAPTLQEASPTETPQTEAAPSGEATSESAAAASQTGPTTDVQACAKCHPNIANAWTTSAHAHAFDDRNFQQAWLGLGSPGECLACHTTNYNAGQKTYTAEGVACEACHGTAGPDHPPAAVSIRATTDYCGSCHTTTLSEWRLSGHGRANVGCSDCHNPHNQRPLFADSDELCINCHKDSMGPYLTSVHGQKGIGCVKCHALVIPPQTPPKDGIVPTGHTFTITPATCVACHTDALHAGFSLPGYEQGAKAYKVPITETQQTSSQYVQRQINNSPERQLQVLQTQVQTLQASLANRNMSILFQGGVVGLVLGGTTAWLVSSNISHRKRESEEKDGDKQE